MKKIILATLGVCLGLFLFVYFKYFSILDTILGPYSVGERTGMITKYSLKGNFYKTHEMDLSSDAMKLNNQANPNITGNVFSCSLPKDKHIEYQDIIKNSMASNLVVKISYKQWRSTPFWIRDSFYEVEKIEICNPNK